jgi:alkanesulfonate monooxygenase
MTMRLHWYLPTHGDGQTVLAAGSTVAGRAPDAAPDSAGGWRPATVVYLTQIALAAEQAGFDAALTPAGTPCEDAWLVAAALSQRTDRLRFIVAFRPGAVAPTLAAQQAATLQRITGGRLALNVVAGGDPVEQRRFGDALDAAGRYKRADEFLSVVRGAWGEEPFDFAGEYLWTDGAVASLSGPPPDIYLGGSSNPALNVTARHADVALTFATPPDDVARRIRTLDELAAQHDRSLRHGVRAHVVTRATSEEAWAVAASLIADADDHAIAAVQEGLARSESVGQRKIRALHGGRRDQLEVHPGLWAGIGLLRLNAGTAFVGSHVEVAALIDEYAAVGVSEFLLSGYPCLEEAYHFGEGVLPLLRGRAGDSTTPSTITRIT